MLPVLRVRNYASWLVALTASLFIPVVGLFIGAMENNNGGRMMSVSAPVLSFIILAFTAFLTPIADMKSYHPKWVWPVGLYAAVGFSGMLFVELDPERTHLASALIPGALFCINVLVTFLIQIWAASERLKLPMWVTLPIHALILVWTVSILQHAESRVFVSVSLGVVVAVVAVALPAVFIADNRLKTYKGQVVDPPKMKP